MSSGRFPLVSQTIEVVVVPAALTRTAAGAITGPLWLRLASPRDRTGDAAFPGDGWSDFPAVVLAWWLAQLARDTGGQEAVTRCEFMDGPFAFTVRRRRGDPLWVLRFPAQPEIQVNGRDLLASMTSSARAVLDACRAAGWDGGDLDTLTRAIEQADAYAA